MSKRPSALLQSISEAQETEKIQTSQEVQQPENNNQMKPPTPLTPSRAKKRNDKEGNLVKVSCYLRPDQAELWDELTDELRMRIKKKKLEYKDIDRQVILREIFDTINQDQIEQLLTAKRSNSRTP